MHSLEQTQLSESEYLALETSSAVRHEYVEGRIFAIAGASIRHNQIAGNLYLEWRRASLCRVVIGDVKLKGNQVYYYPDVMLSCAPVSDPLVESEPCLVAEVLSPGTAAVDRGEKLHHYQQLASLQAYLLAAQDERRLEIYRRSGDLWTYESITDDRPILLPCLDQPLSIGSIYQDVEIQQIASRSQGIA